MWGTLCIWGLVLGTSVVVSACAVAIDMVRCPSMVGRSRVLAQPLTDLPFAAQTPNQHFGQMAPERLFVF
jgi:hypothetical protein